MLVVTVIFGTIIILVSCNKEDIYPEYYTLLVENKYFEPIDSIAIDNQTEHTDYA